VVHRDFKPDNVLISEDGRVLVSDFGLAWLETDDADGSQSGPVGTPAYMSPEQRRGAAADARSDQYSFCATLYEALYRVRPFPGATLTAIDRSAERGPAPAASRVRVPAWLRRAVVRGMDPEPGKRHPDMRALVRALERRPQRIARRVAVVTVVAAACVVGGIAVDQARTFHCPDPSARLAGVWDSDARVRVHKAFLATGHPDAERLSRLAAEHLDEYVDAWGRSSNLVCAADHEDGVRSESAGARCLGSRLAALGAVVDVLASADAAVVEHVDGVVSSLEAATSCVGDTSMPSKVPIAKAQELMARYARIMALVKALKATELRELLPSFLTDAHAAGELALEARGLLIAAAVEDGQGAGSPSALAKLWQAAGLAERAGDDLTVAKAYSALSESLGKDPAKRGEAHQLGELALAAVARLGGHEEMEGAIDMRLALLSANESNFDAALAYYERAAALEHLVGNPDAERLARLNRATILGNLGRTVEARQELARVRALVAHPKTDAQLLLGDAILAAAEHRYEDAARAYDDGAAATLSANPRSLSAGAALFNAADMYRELSRYEDALERAQRALAIMEKGVGSNNPSIEVFVEMVGDLERLAGRPERAIPLIERALALAEPAGDADPDLPWIRFSLAQALWGRSSERPRARELAAKALAQIKANPKIGLASSTTSSPVRADQIDAWLKTHR
jgi:tetratricopeptide (TPR) repeat protein